MTKALLLAAFAVPLVACSGDATEPTASTAQGQEVAEIPESLAPFGEGYPSAGDRCRQLGESDATRNYLDDSALLVGCPSEEAAAAIGGDIVGNVDGVRLVSVPMDQARAAMETNGPPPPPDGAMAAEADVAIRGPDSLETRCADRVADFTGAPVLGTNRIEESEAAIDVYINIEGATAPWLCRAFRNGNIAEVMFTGDEGAL